MYINPVSNTNQSQSSFKSLKYVGKAYEKMLGEIRNTELNKYCEKAHLTYPTIHVNYVASDFLKSKGLISYDDIHKFNSAPFIESYNKGKEFGKSDVLIKDFTQNGYKYTFDVEVPDYNYSGNVEVMGNNWFFPLLNPQKLLNRISQDGFFDKLIKDSPLYQKLEVAYKEYLKKHKMPTMFFEV